MTAAAAAATVKVDAFEVSSNKARRDDAAGIVAKPEGAVVAEIEEIAK